MPKPRTVTTEQERDHMAYWDSTEQRIIHFADEPWPGYPGWLRVDCGCCGGVQWGGDVPEECHDCGGAGHYAKHIASRRLAAWPGGPFLGQDCG